MDDISIHGIDRCTDNDAKPGRVTAIGGGSLHDWSSCVVVDQGFGRFAVGQERHVS
jgi:hypothetical protein